MAVETMSAVTNRELPLIVQRIADGVSPDAIWLFGSRARGDHDEQSDYDILVVADMPGVPAKKRSNHIRRLFPRRSFALDVVVKTPREFEQSLTVRGHLCRIVRKEGRVVYER